jgi:hypothetical protein
MLAVAAQSCSRPPRPDCGFFAGNGGHANAGRVGHPECGDATPQRRVVAIAGI